MNHVYRLVFNHALGVMQVASELTCGSGGARAPAPTLRLRRAVLAAALALAANAHAASSLPTGLTVGNGTVTQGVSGDGLTMTLTQSGSKALLNWSDFSIGSGYTVNFAQESTSAIALNVVTGAVASEIHGTLSANGGVFLINPNGILFGAGSQVNVGSLVATTLALTDDDGTNYEFTKSGGSTAVANYGTITASGGSVTLLGPALVNTGVISADSIAMLGADKATLTYEPGLGMSAMLQTRVSNPGAVSSVIDNTGTLSGDSVTLRALLQSGLLDTAINMGGTITANTLSVDATGAALVSSADVTADNMNASSSAAFSQSSGGLDVGSLNLAVTGSATLSATDNSITTIQGSVGGGLSLVNSTALGQAAALSVGGTTTIDNGSADIGLTDAGNLFGGTVSLSGGDIGLASAGALTIGSVDATGDITLSGSTLALTNALDAGDNALSLSATAGSLSPGVALSGGAVSLYGAGGITLGADVDAQSLTLGSNNAAIMQSAGALDVGGLTSVDAGTGEIVLNRATNTLDGAVSVSGGDVSLANASALVLGDGDIGGTLTAQSSGAISQLADTTLVVDGASQFTAGGDITLANDGNTFGSTVDLSGDAITLATAQDLAVGSVTADGDVALTGGTLALNSALDVGTHAMALTASAGALGIGQSLTGGAVSLRGRDGITLGSTVTAQTLALDSSNAAIAQTGGGLQVAGATSIDAGTGSVTLGSATNAFGGVVTGNGGALDFAATGTLTLGDVTGGSLAAEASTISLAGSVQTTGDQTYTGDVSVHGDAVLDSTGGGDLTFTSGITDGPYGGSMRLATTGAVAIGGDVDLTGLLSVDAGSFSAQAIRLQLGSLDLTTNSALTQNGAYQIAGTTWIDAGGNAITLDNAGNDFRGAVSLTGGAIRITDASSLVLDDVVAGSLSANARGTLTTGAIAASQAVSLVAAGGVTLQGQVSAQDDILVETQGLFRNEYGANALASSNGRWLVHLASPGAAHQYNGLDSGNTALLGVTDPAAINAAGNRYLFSDTGNLVLTTTDATKVYGDTADVGNAYQAQGLLQGVAGAYLGHTLSDVFATVPVATSTGTVANAPVAGGPYAIEIDTTNLVANGYAVQVSNIGQLTVDPKLITGNITVADKTYDGTTDAATDGILDGVIAGDDVDFATSGSFSDKNAGVGKTVNVTGTISGSDAGNYTLDSNSTTTATIDPKSITGNITVADKTYDGTIDADTDGILDGVIAGDDVDFATSGSFSDKNAGVGKTVNVGGTISGSDAGNYILDSNSTTTATIDPKSITGNITVADKTYDGTIDADTDGILDGVIAGDNVDFATSGSFSDKNAGVGKTVNVGGTISGSDAGNYILDSNSTTTATIDPANLVITADDVDKLWGALVALSGYTVEGLVATDTLTSVALSSDGQPAEALPGNYRIDLADVQGEGLGNYAIIYHPGQLTVLGEGNPSQVIGKTINASTNTGGASPADLVAQGNEAAPDIQAGPGAIVRQPPACRPDDRVRECLHMPE